MCTSSRHKHYRVYMPFYTTHTAACMCILPVALAQETTTRDGDRPATERPTRDFPDDGTVLDCRRTAAEREAILNCDCMLMRDVDGCAVCPADCPGESI